MSNEKDDFDRFFGEQPVDDDATMAGSDAALSRSAARAQAASTASSGDRGEGPSRALPLAVLIGSLAVIVVVASIALFGRGGSGDPEPTQAAPVTVTVDSSSDTPPEPTPPASEEPSESSPSTSTSSSSSKEVAAIKFPGNTSRCGEQNTYVVKDSRTRCNFAAGIVQGAQGIAEGESGQVRVWSPNVEQYYRFTCTHEVASYIHCVGKGEEHDTGTPEIWVRPAA